MKLEKFSKPDGQGITVKFDEQEVPIVSEILRSYSVKNADKLERIQWLGYVTHSFLATAAKHGGTIDVNVEDYAYPIFMAEMNQAAADYEDDLLAFRQVLTPLSLGLLRADVSGESPTNSDEGHPESAYDEGLLSFDEKLENVDRLATSLEYFAKLSADKK